MTTREQQITHDMTVIHELEATKTTYVGRVMFGEILFYPEDSPAIRNLKGFLSEGS